MLPHHGTMRKCRSMIPSILCLLDTTRVPHHGFDLASARRSSKYSPMKMHAYTHTHTHPLLYYPTPKEQNCFEFYFLAPHQAGTMGSPCVPSPQLPYGQKLWCSHAWHSTHYIQQQQRNRILSVHERCRRTKGPALTSGCWKQCTPTFLRKTRDCTPR